MFSGAIYPWLEKSWNNLDLNHQETFPHGIIISGLVGIGRHDFCQELISSLLCMENGENALACGSCRACQLAKSGANSDFKKLELESGKTQIGVEQVRDCIAWINTSHQFDAKKVLYIPEADLMTIQAANSLLKTLEEPPAETVIILLVEHVESLIPTIRSRCRILTLNKPEGSVALEWLQNEQNRSEPGHEEIPDLELLLHLCGGAPVRAKEMLQGEGITLRKTIFDALFGIITQGFDPIESAKSLEKLEVPQVVFWFYTLMMDFIRYKSGLQSNYLVNKDYLGQIQDIQGGLNLILLDQLYTELNQYYQKNSRQLNQQLLLESLLIRWSNCYSVL